MANTKHYEVDGFRFEFAPNGGPYKGLLKATSPELEPYTAEINLPKHPSRNGYAGEAAEVCGMSKGDLKRALNALCSKISEEVAAAKEAEQTPDVEEDTPEVDKEEIGKRVGCPGVLERFTDDAAGCSNVIGERDVLRLIALGALSAQLSPLPSGKPSGTNIIVTAEAGRGKNHVCDAVARLLPREFCFPFVSASAKSLYYKAQNEPDFFKHRWVYPNEAEGTDLLVETLRPLLSGGVATHITVNKSASGSNAGQELPLEGPVTITIPTVRNKLDHQLQTRMLVADLPDYPGRVAAHSRAISGQMSANFLGTDYSCDITAWQASLNSLTSIRRVVVPVENDWFCFDSDRVSHGARLWSNVMGLMCAHAWLEQKNREVKTLRDGETAIVATAEDYEVAYAVFKATCERSVINLSDAHRKILDAVYALRDESQIRVEWSGFTQRAVATRAKVSQSTVSTNKSFLVKSVKMLVETDGGKLNLVDGADPSWWGKRDALDGFPKPGQVREWWTDDRIPPDPTDRADRRNNDAEDARGDGRSGAREFADRKEDDSDYAGSADDKRRDDGDRAPSDRKNGAGKRRPHLHDLLIGAIGAQD